MKNTFFWEIIALAGLAITNDTLFNWIINLNILGTSIGSTGFKFPDTFSNFRIIVQMIVITVCIMIEDPLTGPMVHSR